MHKSSVDINAKKCFLQEKSIKTTDAKFMKDDNVNTWIDEIKNS